MDYPQDARYLSNAIARRATVSGATIVSLHKTSAAANMHGILPEGPPYSALLDGVVKRTVHFERSFLRLSPGNVSLETIEVRYTTAPLQ
jgi:hypothetical protein